MVLGIVSLPASILTLFTLPIPVTAIVLGIISIKRKKGFALAGIILGAIGLILSIVLLVVAVNVKSKQDAKINSASRSSAQSSGDQVASSCYSFNLPSGLTKKDIRKNNDCLTMVVNTSSTEDFAVASSPVSANITDANRDALLEKLVEEVGRSAGDAVKVTNTKYITIDGQRAYLATGTESQGNYKYISFLAVLSPKEYLSVSGVKLRAFVLASDSATSKDVVESVAKSWRWQ